MTVSQFYIVAFSFYFQRTTISALCCLAVLPILLTVYVLFCLYFLANKMMMMINIKIKNKEMQAWTGTGIHEKHIKYTALQTSNPAVQVMHGKYRYKALATTQVNLHVLNLHTRLNLKLRITVCRLPTTIQNCTHSSTECLTGLSHRK